MVIFAPVCARTGNIFPVQPKVDDTFCDSLLSGMILLLVYKYMKFIYRSFSVRSKHIFDSFPLSYIFNIFFNSSLIFVPGTRIPLKSSKHFLLDALITLYESLGTILQEWRKVSQRETHDYVP